MKTHEIWFLRWVWIPIHWKGWVFLLVSMPILFGMFFLVANAAFRGEYLASGAGAVALFALVIWLNIFTWKRSI